VAELTGRQLLDFMMNVSQGRLRSFPFVGGMRCELTPDEKDGTQLKTAKLLTLDGKRFDMKRKYRVVTNSYVASTCKLPMETAQVQKELTTDAVMRYLEKQGKVSYKGVRRLTFK